MDEDDLFLYGESADVKIEESKPNEVKENNLSTFISTKETFNEGEEFDLDMDLYGEGDDQKNNENDSKIIKGQTQSYSTNQIDEKKHLQSNSDSTSQLNLSNKPGTQVLDQVAQAEADFLNNQIAPVFEDDTYSQFSEESIDIIIDAPLTPTNDAEGEKVVELEKLQPDSLVQLKMGVENKPKNNEKVGIDINPTAYLDEVDIFELNLDQFEDKPWRKPGADITDYFNYGFNEKTWYAYAQKQQEIREAYGDKSQDNQSTHNKDNNRDKDIRHTDDSNNRSRQRNNQDDYQRSPYNHSTRGGALSPTDDGYTPNRRHQYDQDSNSRGRNRNKLNENARNPNHSPNRYEDRNQSNLDRERGRERDSQRYSPSLDSNRQGRQRSRSPYDRRHRNVPNRSRSRSKPRSISPLSRSRGDSKSNTRTSSRSRPVVSRREKEREREKEKEKEKDKDRNREREKERERDRGRDRERDRERDRGRRDESRSNRDSKARATSPRRQNSNNDSSRRERERESGSTPNRNNSNRNKDDREPHRPRGRDAEKSKSDAQPKSIKDRLGPRELSSERRREENPRKKRG